eukprot:9616138-Alexandrium_andersonii.AAC.1
MGTSGTARVPETVRKRPKVIGSARKRSERFRAVPEVPVVALYTGCWPCSCRLVPQRSPTVLGAR